MGGSGRAEPFLLDAREPSEFGKGHVEGAVNIFLGELRGRMHEVPLDRDIWTYCLAGQRSYHASRTLSRQGYGVETVSGGYWTYTLKKAMP
jgi:rhodanese-related sulfurtransferase